MEEIGLASPSTPANVPAVKSLETDILSEKDLYVRMKELEAHLDFFEHPRRLYQG